VHDRAEATMGRLIVSVQCTIDGLIDRIPEWFAPDKVDNDASLEQLRAADALLLGRKTFEGLAGYWESRAEDRGFGQLQSPMTKYVASRTPDRTKSLPWKGQWLDGDLAKSVTALKEQGTELISYGCGQLAHALVQANLVDELRVWIHPMVWGAGPRPFHDLGKVRMDVVTTTTFDSGVVRLSGRPRPA
jgi:dihydrofolate reductase